MPEDQGVWGESWNSRLNTFTREMLLWRQHGTSNNDIYCDNLGKKVGIDSVFSYRRNLNSAQQIVIAEAKSLQKMDYFNRSRMQKWVEDFVPKLECVPHSEEFNNFFLPDTEAQYQLGLLALWIRDQSSYSYSDIENVLSQIHLPQRRNPINICFISNWHIVRFCAIHSIVTRLRNLPNYREINYFIPIYGTQPDADGTCLPIESLVSKLVFCKARKIEKLKGNSDDPNTNIYDNYIVFYLGDITNYADVKLIGLALRYFQMIKAPEIDIYTTKDATEIRNDVENFRQEFGNNNTEYNFHQLDLTSNIPGWLNSND
jgi:hypothetical protein